MTPVPENAPQTRRPFANAAVFVSLLAAISGPLLVVTWYELYALRAERADAYHAELRALARVVAEGLVDPLWNLTPAAGAEIADAVFENQQISAIKVTSDLRGQPYHRERPVFDAVADWQVTENVLYDGRVIGTVTLWHALALAPFAAGDRATSMVVVGIVQLAFGIAIVIFVLRVARQSERNRVLAESHGDLSTQLAEVAGSRRQFQLVTDSLPVRILRLDPQQVIRFVNIPAAHDQQREPREMVGRPLSEFYAPDTVAAMQPHIRRALDGDHHESDWVARPKAPDDVEKIFSDEWIPERDETGSISGLFWLSTDVTDQRRRIREERQSNQLESLGQLTGGIAHDFNNLLLVVGGNLELLGDDVADRPELLDFLSRAQAAVERGARLTRQLLAFASNQVLAPDWVDVNDMLREFQELLSRTLGDNVAVGLDLADELPKVRVDRAQLESAIINLALNARDAMPDGGRLTLTTELQQTQVATGPGEPQEEYVVVEATDTGVGMTPEVMERVFEPFYTTKDVGKGTGLGLSMVYGFVRQSNGTVTVRSEPGVGTSFRILLPTVGSASPAPELASPVSANPGAAATAEDAAGPPAADGEALPRGSETVLAVDDSDDVRKIAVHILSGLGYRVLEASTAADALHVLSENRGGIDLVFSDVMMPGGMLGTDLARHARSLYPSLRVVLTSASEDAAPTGAEDFVFIIKPYRRSDLARTVRKILDRPA